MRRRHFIGLVGGAVAAGSVSALAQKVPRPTIGFLSGRSSEEASEALAAFRKGLKVAGFSEDRNVAIEYRWAQGRYEQLPALAADLVHRSVSVIVTTGGDAAGDAAIAATKTIPIVFLHGGDPVLRGLVASLNRPGGNATGVTLLTAELEAKRLELLHEMVPKAATIGLLVNPTGPSSALETRETQEATRTSGLQLNVFNANSENDLDAAFASFPKLGVEALQVGSDAFFLSSRALLVKLAARYAIPTIYHAREMPAIGGLMSYGANFADTYRQLGIYAGRILEGVKPADLPVLQPTKFELVINLTAAKALGLNVPTGLLVAADEVIE
jgi:putative tryptophan/tyrosine transport system substrate-binding protein